MKLMRRITIEYATELLNISSLKKRNELNTFNIHKTHY